MSAVSEELVEQIARRIEAKTQQGLFPMIPLAAKCVGCENVGHCAKVCADDVSDAVTQGAARVSASIGVGAVAPNLAGLIDHTLLKPNATLKEIRYLCAEAIKYGFASVCVNPMWVKTCADLLAGHKPLVCTVIGFPLGANSSAVKAFEARQAVAEGAGEVDMVIAVGALKSGKKDHVLQDIRAVVQAASGVTVKVILETALLNDREKVDACLLAKKAGADFVKTSTGFSTGGATAADIALMRRTVGAGMGVKASGGVRNYEDLRLMVGAGASRIGASAGVKIVDPKPGEASSGGGY